jgi:peptidylprolyl isomerase
MMGLKKMIDTTRSPDLREDAIRALASVFPDFGLVVFRGWRSSTEPPIAALQSLGVIATKRRQSDRYTIDWLREFLSSADKRRSSAALESWVSCWRLLRPLPNTTKDSSADKEFRAALLDALHLHSEAGNAVAVQIIAEALSDSLFASVEHIAPLVGSLQKFSSSDNVETVVSLLDAIGKLKDSAAAMWLRTYTSDASSAVRRAAVGALRRCGIATPSTDIAVVRATHDWKLLASFRRNPTAVVRTTRGEFRFELFYEDAPFTIESFITLARTHFYDGLVFHRVVPNFVVQGGDPSGDGTGGPPYTIRSEFSTKSFHRGTVGIASSGKDTEGSQFFVMHSSAPHLDGRYTLFGAVTEGMEVVDRLEVGDRMLSIRIDE